GTVHPIVVASGQNLIQKRHHARVIGGVVVKRDIPAGSYPRLKMIEITGYIHVVVKPVDEQKTDRLVPLYLKRAAANRLYEGFQTGSSDIALEFVKTGGPLLDPSID